MHVMAADPGPSGNGGDRMTDIELPRVGEALLRFRGHLLAEVANDHHAIRVYAVAEVPAPTRSGYKQEIAKRTQHGGFAAQIAWRGGLSFAKLFKRKDSCEEWVQDHRPLTYLPGGRHDVDREYQALVDRLYAEWT